MSAQAGAGSSTLPFNAALVPVAKIAHQLATQYCPHALGGDCTWYHSAWLYLRALGLVKSAGGHGEFLRDRLGAIARTEGSQRVLVSGAADDATMLAAVAAFCEAAVPLALTLVDRCETPLALSRWSAARVGTTIATHHIDALDFEAASAFDVVVANSFLSFVHESGRPRLFRRWAALLEPGGKLLLTNRLRPGATPAGVGFTTAQADLFCCTAHEQAMRHEVELGMHPSAVESMAQEYTMRVRGFPLGTVEELVALLDQAGFAIAEMDVAAAGMSRHAITGPASAESGQYVRVLARRQ